MDFTPLFQSNRSSTGRMRRLIQRLPESQLSQSLANGWTVAQTLAHLAFWDQRVIHVIELARKNNELKLPYFDDQLNDILASILAAIPPQAAANLALETAARLDALLEECLPELLEEIYKANNRLVERSLHRNDHLDEIEKQTM